MPLNGKKTLLGLIVTFLPSLITDVGDVLNGGGDTVMKAVAIGGKLLIVIGAAHKMVKGDQ